MSESTFLSESNSSHENELEEPDRQMPPTRLDLALETSEIGLWDLNFDTGSLIWDARMKMLFHVDPSTTSFTVNDWQSAVHPDDLLRLNYEISDSVSQYKRFNSGFRIIGPTGEIKHIHSIGTLYFNERDERCIVGVCQDVSNEKRRAKELKKIRLQLELRNNELHQAKAKLEHVAQHDTLTGLPNRRYLERMLESHQNGEIKSLLMVDLDRFKYVNDTLGHAAGDALLKHISKTLSGLMRGTDFIARTGGDEFVILCFEEINLCRLEKLSNRMIQEIGKPFFYESETCTVGASVGVLSDASGELKPETLLMNADLALYDAKKNGRNRFTVFTDGLRNRQAQRKLLADEIVEGLQRREFIPFFQPQYSTINNKLVGLEVLVRWQHPKQGLLSPSAFLDMSAEIGVTSNIDHLVLSSAILQATAWKSKGLDVPKISVNVSHQRISDEKLIEELSSIGCSTHKLSFELVESIFLDDADEQILSNIEKIKDLGIEIEIDDFGTAYTSLLSLLKIRPNRLKIDRQLVGPSVECIQTKQIIKSIVDIANSLGIEILAEGIETTDHADLMTKLGCDALQGYLFGYPVSAYDCGRLIADSNANFDSYVEEAER